MFQEFIPCNKCFDILKSSKRFENHYENRMKLMRCRNCEELAKTRRKFLLERKRINGNSKD